MKQDVKLKINLGFLTSVGIAACAYVTGKAVGYVKGYSLARKGSTEHVDKDVKEKVDDIFETVNNVMDDLND